METDINVDKNMHIMYAKLAMKMMGKSFKSMPATPHEKGGRVGEFTPTRKNYFIFQIIIRWSYKICCYGSQAGNIAKDYRKFGVIPKIPRLMVFCHNFFCIAFLLIINRYIGIVSGNQGGFVI